GGRAVQDHAVGARGELVEDAGGALLGGAGGGRGQPFVREQPGDVPEVAGRPDHVEGAGVAGDEVVGAEALQDRGVPAVDAHQQVAVALQVGGQAADELAEAQLLVQVVADGGEDRPDPHGVRVAPGFEGPAADGRDRLGQGLVGEEGVQDDAVRDPAGELQGPVPHRREDDRDVLVEGRVLAEVGEVPGGSVVDRKSTRLNSSHVKISYAVF